MNVLSELFTTKSDVYARIPTYSTATRKLQAPKQILPTYTQTTATTRLHPIMPPSPTHLISRVGDPLFALFIGLSAAATRISREEKEQGRSTQQTIDAGFRYGLFVVSLFFLFGLVWGWE